MNVALVSLCTVNGGLNPIGVLCLAAWIKKLRPHDSITILEATRCDLLSEILRLKFDVIGLSAMTLEYEDATQLAKKIRMESSARIILGGVHISLMPESFRRQFDVGVIGEGERTLCDLLDAIEDGTTFDHINGIVFFIGDNLIIKSRRAPISLEDYPPLPWELLPTSYWKHRALGLFGNFGREAEIITTRGCPFRCVFCATTQFWRSVRSFSAEWIIRELKTLSRFGINHVQVVDDLFTIRRSQLRQLVHAIKQNGLHRTMTFALNSKADLLDDEMCRLLKEMNCTVIGFGFESGSDRVLKMLKGQSASVESNRKAIKLCVAHGLHAVG
jgi:anaerobic magnesium-protoporphyrin IX monomethyl ester cyclase